MESDIQQAKKLVLDWQKATDNAALAEMPACGLNMFRRSIIGEVCTPSMNNLVVILS